VSVVAQHPQRPCVISGWATRRDCWTHRTALISELSNALDRSPGYPIRSMVGIALAKPIYAVPTWTRLVALITEHAAPRATVTGSTPMPTVYACYRLTAKLARQRRHARPRHRPRDRSLHPERPDIGRDASSDVSDTRERAPDGRARTAATGDVSGRAPTGGLHTRCSSAAGVWRGRSQNAGIPQDASTRRELGGPLGSELPGVCVCPADVGAIHRPTLLLREQADRGGHMLLLSSVLVLMSD